MSTIIEVVAGSTAPIDISLLSKGAVPSGTMAGDTVTLQLHEYGSNRVVTIAGSVSILDATNWQVRYSPDAADLTPGTFHGRFKVVDGNSKIAYFPSGEWDEWIVRSV